MRVFSLWHEEAHLHQVGASGRPGEGYKVLERGRPGEVKVK